MKEKLSVQMLVCTGGEPCSNLDHRQKQPVGRDVGLEENAVQV